jgi:hypothetical protein
MATITDNDKTYTTNIDKANAFNNFFQSQTELADNNKQLPEITQYVHNHFEDINITPLEVASIPKSLCEEKAVGPDLINNKILKEVFKVRALCPVLFLFGVRLGSLPLVLVAGSYGGSVH